MDVKRIEKKKRKIEANLDSYNLAQTMRERELEDGAWEERDRWRVAIISKNE